MELPALLLIFLTKYAAEVTVGQANARLERKQRAINTISLALTGTQAYYIQHENRCDYAQIDNSSELSHLWRTAAELVRPFDSELAKVLSKKGDFWLDPKMWSASDVDKAGIRLEEVEKAYKKMARLE